MVEQLKIGKQIDNGQCSLFQVFQDVEENGMPPPIFPDAVMHLMKTTVLQVLVVQAMTAALVKCSTVLLWTQTLESFLGRRKEAWC
jgi:hypothetical protein